MAESAGGTREEFNRNQIVVATPHVGDVLRVLDDYGVGTVPGKDSRELGLTLLELPASKIDEAARKNESSDAPKEALSRLLQMVYRHFKKEYNFVPTMGKNRLVRPVMGTHNIGGGGACAPEDVAMNLPRRRAEPGRGVRVGIADTAVYDHPWLAGAYQAAPASVWGDDQPKDFEGGHATFIAGLILQQAPGATLEIRSALDESATADGWEVAKELVRFANSGLDVLNLSFGCMTDDNEKPLLLATALDRLDTRVVVVAAAGNQGKTADARRPVWPAALEEVVAVCAVDDEGNVSPWSAKPDLPWVDVAAGGDPVSSTYLRGKFTVSSDSGDVNRQFDGFASWSGTSFAAATVSGAIAARTVPGEFGASAAWAQLLRESEKLPEADHVLADSVPWIK